MSSNTSWRVDQGDAIELLRREPAGSVDLVYMDPPFATGRILRGREASDRFDDRWPDRGAYFTFMRSLLHEAHRVLKSTGSVMVHCDWRTCHHLWIELEACFGAEHAVNHLIWTYGLGGSGPRSFARKHDDILFFAKSSAYWFDAPRVPSRSRRMAGTPKKATDVLDIPSLNNMALERTGWPSQKPLELLRVLIGAACPSGGAVLDPCCGSGTALVAAVELGRRAIGFDRSLRAVAIATRRLRATSAPQAEDAAAAIDSGAKRPSRRRKRSRATSRLGATVVK
ncbi:MAG: site-specific DNA-methyltransferase [Phycisphaeraceae bacterium]|nr:site-specific DNA-methyltransferase [Phycisphaeraceae bacterium]